MLSILKVELQTNRACRPLHLSPSVVKVRSLLGLEASSALIYNGYIQQQHQPSWYLPILPSNVMKTLQTITELQVRDKFWCAFKIGAYLQIVHVHQRCLPIFQVLEVHDLWRWQHRCIVRLAIQAQWHTFSYWHPFLRAKASHFKVDERESLRITAPIKENRFTSVCNKVKGWVKRALWLKRS